jgi:cytochrome P450
MLGAANRDLARFADPDGFDITRRDVAHHALGGRSHFCLGQQLARMEARTAIEGFVRRFERPRIDYAGLNWSQSFFRVLGSLPVRFA